MTTNTAELTLLQRAAKQLTEWHKQYGANNPQWLPPAGDVRLLEDIDEALAGRSAAHGEQGKAAVVRDWVTCPVCSEPDMRKETDSEGNSLIFCTNYTCKSNGGTKAGSAEQVSEERAFYSAWDKYTQSPTYDMHRKDDFAAFEAAWQARAALSAPERIQDETQLAIDLTRVAHNYVENGEMRHDVGIALIEVVRKHAAPERKVTDAEIDAMVKHACHSDPVMASGEYCLTIDEVRALLNQQGEQTAPEGWKWVPIEPDLKMVIAGENYIGRHAWEKMIAAAPSPAQNYPLCKWCGADLRQEGCKGDLLTCAIRGVAHKDGVKE